MHPIIENYGKELTRELLDIMFIYQKVDSDKIRQLMINHGVIKATTRKVYGFFNTGTVSTLFEPKDNTKPHDAVTNPRVMKRLSKPIITYNVTAYNGRNQQILGARVIESEFEDLYRELNAEE